MKITSLSPYIQLFSLFLVEKKQQQEKENVCIVTCGRRTTKDFRRCTSTWSCLSRMTCTHHRRDVSWRALTPRRRSLDTASHGHLVRASNCQRVRPRGGKTARATNNARCRQNQAVCRCMPKRCRYPFFLSARGVYPPGIIGAIPPTTRGSSNIMTGA